jgi:hypothetical protein
MGGLLLDVWIEFVIRIAINLYRRATSRSWTVVRARVTGGYSERGSTAGSELAIVNYRYKVEGELFTGKHKEPFLLSGRLDDYVSLFPADGECWVRVSPADPSRSFLN